MRSVFFIFLLAAITFAKERDTLIITFGDDWKPYYSRTGEGRYEGLDVELITAIFREAKIPVKMVSVPTARGHEYLKTGQADVMSCASYTDKRSEYARFSKPYRSETVALMIRKEDLARYPMKKLNDIGSFEGAVIAYERGGWYGSQFSEALADSELTHHFYETTGIDSRLKMLAAGRVTMVIDDYYSLAVTARSLKLNSSFVFHPLRPSEEPIHFMFSRSSVSENTVNRVNSAIGKLKANGTISRILARWGK